MKMDNGLIKKLKQNGQVFGVLPTKEQYILREAHERMGLLAYYENVGWSKMASDEIIQNALAYRLQPDYQPEPEPEAEPEVEKCKVYKSNKYLKYERDGYRNLFLTHAANDPDFIHYEYSDGGVSSRPRFVTNDKATGQPTGEPALIPTHVLFKKQ